MAGLVGGQFDPGLVIATSGILLLAFSTAQLFNPYMLRVEDRAWLDEMAAEHEATHALAADLTTTMEHDLSDEVLPEDVTP